MRNPARPRISQSTGSGVTAIKRQTEWALAREIRACLKPHRSQEETAKAMNLSRQAVEQIELRALAKIVHAFRLERST